MLGTYVNQPLTAQAAHLEPKAPSSSGDQYDIETQTLEGTVRNSGASVQVSKAPEPTSSQTLDVSPSGATVPIVGNTKPRGGSLSSHSGERTDVKKYTTHPLAQVTTYTNAPRGGTQAATVVPTTLTNSSQPNPPSSQILSTTARSRRSDADPPVDTVSPIPSVETPNPEHLRSKGSDSVSTAKTREAPRICGPSRNDSLSVPQGTTRTQNRHAIAHSGFGQPSNHVQGSPTDSRLERPPAGPDIHKRNTVQQQETSVQLLARERDVPKHFVSDTQPSVPVQDVDRLQTERLETVSPDANKRPHANAQPSNESQDISGWVLRSVFILFSQISCTIRKSAVLNSALETVEVKERVLPDTNKQPHANAQPRNSLSDHSQDSSG